MIDFNIEITKSAINRVKNLIKRKNDDAKLRISVESGGCSGMQYKYELVSQICPDDKVINKEDITILIDSISKNFLEGCTVDYVQSLGNAYFEIRNPIASSKCGCGNSFAV